MKKRNAIPRLPISEAFKAIKRALGFKMGAGRCGTCEFFARLPVGKVNRCRLAGFPCSSKHGCNAYRQRKPVEEPTMAEVLLRNSPSLSVSAKER